MALSMLIYSSPRKTMSTARGRGQGRCHEPDLRPLLVLPLALFLSGDATAGGAGAGVRRDLQRARGASDRGAPAGVLRQQRPAVVLLLPARHLPLCALRRPAVPLGEPRSGLPRSR